MATFTDRLMGEVIDNPQGQERDVEFLLISLLRCLVDEQKLIPLEEKTEKASQQIAGDPLR